MTLRSRGSGKGHQGPRMGTGTSVEMFLRHHGGAWVHGSIAADGFDPSAVKGLCHEARSRVRNRAVMVDPAGIPELLGVSEGARRRNQVLRPPINENTKNHKRTDTKLNALIHDREVDHPYRPYIINERQNNHGSL